MVSCFSYVIFGKELNSHADKPTNKERLKELGEKIEQASGKCLTATNMPSI